MLYQLYETQRTLMEPFADLAQATARAFNNPLSPLAHLPHAQRFAAGYSLLHRLGKDYEKPEFGIRTVSVDGVSVAIHERVEIDKPFCELRRFKRFTDDPATLTRLKSQPVVLIVAPLSGHYATLLRDTVRTMLKDHKVYITDWKNAHGRCRRASSTRRLRQLRAGVHPPPAGYGTATMSASPRAGKAASADGQPRRPHR
jgi:poly(3-hydroxybutyrate) depolymerase